MFIRNWKTEIVTIPNLLSLIRLLLIPVYVTIYRNATQPREYLLAGAVLAVSCLTDAVDGIIARKFHMVSTLGKILDPLADKLTQITLTICLSLTYPALLPVISLLLIKELLQLIGALLLLRRGTPFPSAMIAGKVSTFVLFATLTALMMFPNVPTPLVSGIALLDSVCLIYAFACYYVTFFYHHGKSHRSQT